MMMHLTAKNFEIEVKKSKNPSVVVVMMYAIWCGKCAMMKPVLEAIEERLAGKVKFCEVDIEESAVLAAEYEADVVPTFVLFRNGQLEGIMRGVLDEKTFEERVRELL